MTRKISGKPTTDNFQVDSIEFTEEDSEMNAESEFYCDTYRELAELIGVNNTKKLWQRYHGLSFQFPQRLYSYEYTRQIISENMDTMNPKELATMLNLTDRRVRQIITELRREEQ